MVEYKQRFSDTRNILLVSFTILFVIVASLSFVLNHNFEEKIVEAQFPELNIPQQTTLLKNSVDITDNSQNRPVVEIVETSLEVYDSEMIFSELESELLSKNKINSKTLFSVLQKVDFNNQMDLENIQLKLKILSTEQLIETEVLLEKLYQLIYNEQMFDGSDLNLNAIAYELLDEFDSDDIIIDLENLVTF